MNFLHMKSFIVAADCKSITAAAKELYITSTSLLQQFNLLEAELGFKVFSRSRKGVTLTRAGQRLYTGYKAILAENEIILKECRALADEDENLVHIGITRPYYLIKVGESCVASHPHSRIEFDRIHLLTSANMDKHFTGSGFDMIQMPLKPEDISEAYNIVPYPSDQLCCVLSQEHPLSVKDTVTLKDLEGQTLETFSNFPQTLSALQVAIEQGGHHITIKSAVFSEEALVKCCANKGIYILEKQTAASFPFLSHIVFSPCIPCHFGLIYKKDAKPAVHQFAQYVRDHMDIIATQYE